MQSKAIRNKISKASIQTEAQTFLEEYNQEYVKLYTTAQDAEWASQTHIVEGDSTNSIRTKAANEALAKFTGSEKNISYCKNFLELKIPWNQYKFYNWKASFLCR